MTPAKYTTAECDICHEGFPAETVWVDRRIRKKQKLLCYACRSVEFIKGLRHTQGRQWAGVPFNLLDWQENEVLHPFFGTVDEHGIRQYRFVYIEVPKKSGKALALDTPIPTVEGWELLSNIQKGDQVFDENGDICSVTFISDIFYGHDCYEVLFSDGEKIVADGEHLWMTWDINAIKALDYCGRSPNKIPYDWVTWDSKSESSYYYSEKDLLRIAKMKANGHDCKIIADKFNTTGNAIQQQWNRTDRHVKSVKPEVITTSQISKTLKKRSQFNHVIPLCKAISHQMKKLPIDPWVLGYLLGDGDSNGSGRVACLNEDREVLMALFSQRGYDVTKDRDDGHFHVKKLKEIWKKINCYNNKHIPKIYFLSAHKQRIDLLRGLLDSDGYVDSHGSYRFSNSNEILIDGVCELGNSLGLKTTKKYRGIRERAKLESWEVIIASEMRLCLLQRKEMRARHNWKREQKVRHIIDIKRVDSVPVKCIQVDSPSHLYLAGKNFVPTHNTELAGAVGNYCLYADGEIGGEVYSAAGDKEQASKTFNAAMEMVMQNTSLKRKTDIIRSRKRMVVPGTNSFFAALSRETFSKHGYNPSCVVIDELHAHRDREMYDVLVEGTDTAREQQVIFIITTAGIYDKTSIGWEVHDYALQVKNGIIDDPTFLPVIYAADEKDDWTSEKTWRKVNPSIDSIVPIEKIRDHYNQVKNIPARQNNFRRFRLNQWVAQLVRWMPMEDWDKCGQERLNPESLYGRKCYGGLDLASTTDIAACALVFPPEEDDEEKAYKALLYFWIPEENIIERGRKDHVPYDMWARAGLIEATPGNVIDYKWIIAALEGMAGMFDLEEIAFDRWGATKIVQDLEDLGFTTASSDADVKDVPTPRLIQFGQGYKSMSPPAKELLNIVLQKHLIDGGNPVLRWMANNIVVRMDPAGNIKPDKEKSVEKIDGMVALIMALDRAIKAVPSGSSYDGMSKEEMMEAMLL